MISVLVICLWISYMSIETSAFSLSHSIIIQHKLQKQQSFLFHQGIRSIFANTEASKDDLEETTKKYGLEAGLLKAAQTKGEDSKTKATELLKKYGIAYLATSITLAIISYILCYVLVANGVDVGALLEKVGIKSSEAAANAGTAGIAYAIHKAASPIRFPPTVALTPIVAGWFGKKPTD